MYLVEGFDGYVMVLANRTDEHHILPTVQTPNGNGLPPLCQNESHPEGDTASMRTGRF